MVSARYCNWDANEEESRSREIKRNNVEEKRVHKEDQNNTKRDGEYDVTLKYVFSNQGHTKKTVAIRLHNSKNSSLRSMEQQDPPNIIAILTKYT